MHHLNHLGRGVQAFVVEMVESEFKQFDKSFFQERCF